MSRSYDVAAIGHALVDVLASASDGFLLEHNIAKGVMTMVDEFRATTLHAAFDRPVERAGGSAANTMAGLASLGGSGMFIGKVKDDRLGQIFAGSLAELGVDFHTARAEGGPQTGCCLIAVTPDGERSMSTYLGAASTLATTDIDEAALGRSGVLYVEGYMWDVPNAKAAITKAIRAARRAQTPIAFTLSDPFCVGRYREEFVALVKNDLDILFANEEELKSLFEVDGFDDGLQALADWKGTAALTRSEKGCVIKRGAEVHVIDAHPVKKVIDTTGAGDQFAAGFLYARAKGQPLDQCGRLGSLAAAEVISHVGARPEANLRDMAGKAGLV